MSILELGSVLFVSVDTAILATIIGFGLVKHTPVLSKVLVWAGANISFFTDRRAIGGMTTLVR